MIKSLMITGAGSGVGRAVAEHFKDDDSIDTVLVGGRREELLAEVAEETNATLYVAGNLFDTKSDAYAAMMDDDSEYQVLAAAINLDTLEVSDDEKNRLREVQNSALEQKLQKMINSSKGNKLLLDINSVTAFFRENSRAQKFPYMVMKAQQSDIMDSARGGLKEAGVDLSVLYPGAIDTAMMAHLDNAKAVKLANMLGKRVTSDKRPEGFIQDNILTPGQIAKCIAYAIAEYEKTGELHPDLEEWIILNENDLRG